MPKILHWLFLYIPVVSWMALIYFLSSQSVLPGPATISFDFVFKKLAHVGVYMVLYLLWFRAMNDGKHAKKRIWILPVILSLGYAMIDEIHQSLTPGRHARFRDVFGYDSLGIFVGFLWTHKYV